MKGHLIVKMPANGFRSFVLALIIGAALSSADPLLSTAWAQAIAVNVSAASREIGYSYTVSQNFGTPADTGFAPTLSKLRIFENGIALGPVHSAHADIRNIGRGRFSHWGGSTGTAAIKLYFSTSDNTDPRTNGRTYTYRIDSPLASAASPGPALAPLKTDLGTYYEPSLPAMGPAGSKIVDSVFGTTILRVTDAATGGSDCFTPYSSYPNLNRTSTRLYVQCMNPGKAVFYTVDATNFTVGNRRVAKDPPTGNALWYGMVWSGVSPDIIYLQGYTELWAYNPGTDSYTYVRNFAAQVSAAGAAYLEQMSVSRNDDVFAFSFSKSDGTHFGYLVWKRSTNQILLNRIESGADEVRLDKSGRYLSVVMANGAARIWDLQTATVTDLGAYWGGNSYVHNDTGYGTIFTGKYGSLAYRSMATPHNVKTILPGYFPGSNMNYSMNADNEAWALVWVQREDTLSNTRPFENELLQVATDGSSRVRRIAHHRSKWNDYRDQPNATISRDGRFVAFTSNWGNANGRRDVYLVRIPPAPAQ